METEQPTYQPTISVIAPVYNTELSLPRCLDSILAQTFANFEVVVVNDGSPDGAANVIAEYAARDARVRVLEQENQGLGAARNAGIRAAQGEYLAFVDSDDAIKPTLFEALLAALREQNASMALCQAENVVVENGRVAETLAPYLIPGEGNATTGQQALTWLLNYVGHNILNTAWGTLVPRALFTENDIRFPEGHRYAEDIPTSVQLFLAASRIALVRENLYEYSHSAGTLTATYSLKKARDILQNNAEIAGYVQAKAPQLKLDNFMLGMMFPLEKQILWSAEANTPEAKALMRQVQAMRHSYTPDFSIAPTPRAQQARIRLAKLGLLPLACRLMHR